MTETQIKHYSLQTIKSIAIRTCIAAINSNGTTEEKLVWSRTKDDLLNNGITSTNKNFVNDVVLARAFNEGLITREMRLDMEEALLPTT